MARKKRIKLGEYIGKISIFRCLKDRTASIEIVVEDNIPSEHSLANIKKEWKDIDND